MRKRVYATDTVKQPCGGFVRHLVSWVNEPNYSNYKINILCKLYIAKYCKKDLRYCFCLMWQSSKILESLSKNSTVGIHLSVVIDIKIQIINKNIPFLGKLCQKVRFKQKQHFRTFFINITFYARHPNNLHNQHNRHNLHFCNCEVHKTVINIVMLAVLLQATFEHLFTAVGLC